MQNKSYIRLGIALVLSTSCWLGTEYYYQKSQKKMDDHGNAKPIAFISEISEQVELRPVTRIVWHLLDKGDPVYPGEMIKTSDLGEATLQFADSSRFLNLEPDSLIVLSQNANNEISLDLMDGNIFVGKGKELAENDSKLSLTLKSGEKTVDLSHATAQLSKSQGKSMDIQVLQGKAKIDANGKSEELDSNNSVGEIQILSPALDKPQFINPENPEPIAYEWKGFPDTATIQLWLGRTRKDLKPWTQFSSKTPNSLNAKIPPGKHFWKLVAVDKNSNQLVKQSPIYRTEVIARYAPAIISPLPDTKTVPTPANTTEFIWNRSEQSGSTTIEIAKDPLLKEKVITKNIVAENSFSYPLAVGDYYWRVSANYSNSNKPVSSKVFKFSVVQEDKKPEPVKSEILIGWIDAAPGPQYFLNDPQVSLSWSSEQNSKIKSWRLKLTDNEEAFTNPDLKDKIQVIDSTSSSVKANVAKPGRYIAMVEALDEKNAVVATSQTKVLEVTPLPLLTAPNFQPGTGELKANNQGRLDLEWTKIEGAKEYWLTLSDKAGKELRKAKFTGNTTALVNLLPGEYKVSVFAMDQHGRESQKIEARSVVVPESSGLHAPKFKKIKVD